jgi:hypothetical protein
VDAAARPIALAEIGRAGEKGMNTRQRIKAYLCVALVSHVIVVAVAAHAVHVAQAYWDLFLRTVPFPVLFLFVVAAAPFLPWFAAMVLAVGIIVVTRASEDTALHALVAVMVLSIGILAVTDIGLGQPMSVATRLADQAATNEVSGAIGVR